jgi:hypothetical protein
MGVVPAWRAEELSVSDKMNKSRLRGVCHNLREVLPGTNDGPQDAEHYVDRAIARIAQLEADLAIARAAMSGAGTPPPMPEPCECNWPDACSCGADARRTQPLPNDPRLP